MNKKTLTFLAVFFVGISPTSVSLAYKGILRNDSLKPDADNKTLPMRMHQETRMQEIDEELKEQLETAITNRDYETWSRLLTENNLNKGSMIESITKENFETYVKMHEAIKSGDMPLADEYMNELGIAREGFNRQRNFNRECNCTCVQ
ncbi:MAG TPA: hypothetical protein VI790_06395 [Candidatus Nanoarchaeia archaeon]|nr:hypothetical protein [Candidatus Nanoarchaeia archaeon]